MRPTLGVLLVSSALLNVALAFYLLRPSATAGPSTPSPGHASLTTTDGLLSPPPLGTNPAASGGDAPPPAPFHWSSIESDDYRQYIANLRAVGCPEGTIRDLIAADLAALYTPRARAILAPKPREYWQKYDQKPPSAAQLKELTALQREQNSVFRELLGGRFTIQDRIDALFLQLHGNEQQLLFLPEARRAAALDLLAQSGVETRELEMQTRGQYSNEEESRLFEEKLKLLARVLDPQEVEEFRLRSSREAQMLRTELQYFTCTPDEFKALLDARMKGKGGTKVATGDLTNRGPATEQVRELWGEERAREFERVTDIHYQQARREVERFGLPVELADGAWEITRDARTAADRIAGDESIPADQRKQQVGALLGNADVKLQQLLGDRASRMVRRDLKVVLGATQTRIQP